MAVALTISINHIAPAELLPGDVWAVAAEASPAARADFPAGEALRLFLGGWRAGGLPA